MTQDIYFEPWQQSEDIRVFINHDNPMDPQQSVTKLTITQVGVFINFFADGDLAGSIALTYDELFEMSQRGYLVNEDIT